jgi:hypothetical protein
MSVRVCICCGPLLASALELSRTEWRRRRVQSGDTAIDIRTRDGDATERELKMQFAANDAKRLHDLPLLKSRLRRHRMPIACSAPVSIPNASIVKRGEYPRHASRQMPRSLRIQSTAKPKSNLPSSIVVPRCSSASSRPRLCRSPRAHAACRGQRADRNAALRKGLAPCPRCRSG